MTSGFAPEFLILLGVDIFLGASILTVLLDKHFPGPFPYVLEGAALIGFAELMSGPAFLSSLSNELQFWYSFIYAMIAVLSLFATNLYLLFLRRRAFESAILGICGTVPAGLGILYFTSAFVNGLTLSLPLIPVVPIEGVYAMFGLSIGLVVFSLVVFGRRARPVAEQVREKEVEGPIIARATAETNQLVIVERGLSDAVPSGAPAAAGEQARPAPGLEPEEAESVRPGNDPAKLTTRGLVSGGLAPASDSQGVASGLLSRGEGEFQTSGTVLVQKTEQTEHAKRLLDSIRFFEKAVDRPVRFDPRLLGATVKGARKAYLTPAGMIMAEDSTGKMISLSLMDISTDEALRVMREVMKGIGDEARQP